MGQEALPADRDDEVDGGAEGIQQTPVLEARLELEVASVAELAVHPHKARRHAALRDGARRPPPIEFNARSAPGRSARAAAERAHETRRGGHGGVVRNADNRLRGPQRAAPGRRRELAAEAPHRDAAARGAVGEEESDAPEHDEAGTPVAGHVV